jgi:DNA primase
MLDGDEVGRKSSRKIAEKLKATSNVYIVNTPEGKDPKNLTYQEFRTLFRNSEKID